MIVCYSHAPRPGLGMKARVVEEEPIGRSVDRLCTDNMQSLQPRIRLDSASLFGDEDGNACLILQAYPGMKMGMLPAPPSCRSRT
jgi:hypothetical protein